MTLIKRASLFAGASVAALGLLAGTALAFGTVDWEWDAYHISDIALTGDFTPSGIVMIDALQTSVGHVTANSVIRDAKNGRAWSSGSRSALVNLPKVASSAMAVGNNLSIDAGVAVGFQVDQLTKDREWFYDRHANIEARSVVGRARNAAVDSSATAVANNFNLTVEACCAGDGVVIGSLIQDSLADVSATSIVRNVNLRNYGNLGNLATPAVNSVATAIGNNAGISVSVGGN